MTNEPHLQPKNHPMVCVRCGKGWPKGFSGMATSVQYPGRWQHFPDCPAVKKQ